MTTERAYLRQSGFLSVRPTLLPEHHFPQARSAVSLYCQRGNAAQVEWQALLQGMVFLCFLHGQGQCSGVAVSKGEDVKLVVCDILQDADGVQHQKDLGICSSYVGMQEQ